MELASMIVLLLVVAIISFTQYATRFISFTQPTILGFYSVVFMIMVFSLLPFKASQALMTRPGYTNFLYAILLHLFFILAPYFLCYTGNINNLRRSTRSFRRSDIQPVRREKIIFFLLFILVSLIFVHQLNSLPVVPILLILQNVSGEELALARETAFKLNDSKFIYLWHFNRMIFAPLLVLTAFLIYTRETGSRRIFWGFILLVAMVLACLNGSISSALAPVAIIFFMLFFLRNYFVKSISIINSILMVAVILTFPVLVEYLFSEDNFVSSASNTILKVFKRFSLETFDRTLVYFDLFPNEAHYLGGSTSRIFTVITGNEYFNVQNYAFLYYLENILGKSLRPHLLYGSLNANFIGYMNADFGLWGVGISSLIMGCIITYFEMTLTKLNKNIFVCSLYVMLVVLFWKMMGSQPSSILIGHGGIPMLLLAVGISWVGSKRFKWSVTQN